MTLRDGPVLLLLMLAAMPVGTMALLVTFPRATPVALCSASVVAIGALIYVCGDERGFLADSYVGRILTEHARMQALPDPRPNWTPWEDG